MTPTRLLSNRVLLVEGKDDEGVFKHLRKFLGLTREDIDIMPYDGRDNLRRRLSTVIGLSDFSEVTVLGIVRDADDNPEGALRSASDALGSFFDNPPMQPYQFAESILQDASFDGQRISTAIAILPGGSRTGELEDLLLEAIDDTRTMACVDQYIGCLEANDIQLHKPAKTKLQAFLASRGKAEDGLWKALVKDHIPADSDSFAEVRGFLSQMAKL